MRNEHWHKSAGTRIFCLLLLFARSAFAAEPAELIREVKPLSIRGVNYYPRETPWDKMWTQTPKDVFENDMAAAARLGVNTVRTFLPFGLEMVKAGLLADDGPPTSAYQEKLQGLLEAGWKHGIRFVLCFEFDRRVLEAPDAAARWQRAMHSMASPLRDDGRVLMWDLMNEPESDEKWTEATRAYLRGAKDFIKQIDPNHLTTIGITYRTDRLEKVGLPDVLQYHEYGANRKSARLGPEPVRKTIDNQRMKQTDRPLFIGEFGLSTARDPKHGTSRELISKMADSPGTEAEQASVYAVVLEAAKAEGLAGAMPWCLYDYPIKDADEAQFGLLRADGSEKPAAKVLREAFGSWGK
jgi:endo-1,4-beta-mannosidase